VVQRFAGNLPGRSMRERYAGDLETVAKKAKATRSVPNVTLPARPLMHGAGVRVRDHSGLPRGALDVVTEGLKTGDLRFNAPFGR